jgi:hypothetical protein
MAKKNKRLGKLPPKYRFFLNHYQEYRFTTCPQCDRTMKVRKHPFLVHVDPMQLALLNMSGRYCPSCDILILHQDKLEEMLVAALLPHNPDVIGNEYLVLGTVERKGWREAQKQADGSQTSFDNLHEFKEVILVEVEPPHWGPAED